MNKKELVSAMADESGLPQKICSKAIDTFFKVVKDRVFMDDPVRIVGIGTFKLNVRKARNGVNPSNGKKIAIPERKRIVFKSGKPINTFG